MVFVLSLSSATACYKKPDQHVSQVTVPPRCPCAPVPPCVVDPAICAARACCSCARVWRRPRRRRRAGGDAAFVLWAAAVTFRGGQCHGAMKAMGITIGKNGQLVVSNKTTFATSNEPSRV